MSGAPGTRRCEVNDAATTVFDRVWDGGVRRWDQDLRIASEASDRDGKVRRWYRAGEPVGVDVSGVEKADL